MSKKIITAGILGVALAASLTTSAMAENFNRTINLSQNLSGQFVIDDLGVGDTVTMTLVNPTSSPLTFTTTQQIGQESSWVIPANSQRTVSFDYNVPFSDDVNFVVMDASGQNVNQGVLVNVDDDIEVEDENVFRQTITLQPGMGEFEFDDLGVGDTLMLTLINPTATPMTFQTTDQLGPESQWVIPANSQRVITYEYTQPFSDDVEYQVTQAGNVVATGVMFEGAEEPEAGQSTIRGYW